MELTLTRISTGFYDFYQTNFHFYWRWKLVWEFSIFGKKRIKFIIFLKNKQYFRKIKEKNGLKNEQLVKFSHFSNLIQQDLSLC